MFQNLSLKQRMWLLLGTFFATIALLLIILFPRLSAVRVGGPIYTEIASTKDLLADILPPPLFMVEAHLEVQEYVSSSTSVERAEHLAALQKLRDAIAERKDYWKSISLHDDVKQQLFDDVIPTAEAFADRMLADLPKMKGDMSLAEQEEYDSNIDSLYQKHLKEALKLVSLTTQQAKVIEQHGLEESSSTVSTIALVAAISLALAMALGILIARSIMAELGGEPATVRRLATSVASGNLDVEVEVATGDKTSILAALKDMLGSLQTSARQAVSNARIKSALDNVSTNVMIADNDRNIVYVNKSVEAMLTVAENDLRKALPHFDVRKLLGTSIDSFHKNPAHQRDLLANLRSTYSTQIVVAGRTFSLIANPVFSEDGSRVGSVVEWKDRTLEVAVEKEVSEIVSAAANGDFSTRLRLEGKEGFFKQLADGLNVLLETSEAGMHDIKAVLDALSKGDLTKQINKEYRGLFGDMKNAANETSAQLIEVVMRIREATDTINTASNEIASGNTDLSSRTEEQASSLEETASSMEELTSTVKQNADNAKQANQLAVTASDIAQKGGNVVQEVVGTMSAIHDSARKIVDIISVIDGIAFQTNILALNAAVEAARAGEQGRGFAVVASEVRNLAQRSAAAAKEIKTLISDSVEKVENGNKLVSQAGNTMQEVVTSIRRVTDIMSEIAAASQEQSRGIEQVGSAITQMDEVTQQNAALVEQAAAAAESLEEQARQLADSVRYFDTGNQMAAVTGATGGNRASMKTTPRLSKSAPKLSRSKPGKPEPEDEWEQF